MKTWIKIVSVLFLTGIIAAILVYFFVYNKPHPDFEKMDAAYTLAAEDFYKTYVTNKTEAGNKYNGKVIAVTGKLTKTETSDSLTVCVFVFNNGMFGDEGLRCTMLPGYGDQVRKLQPGSEVNLKGFCTGFNDTDVVLDKCSIVKK
ncbi:MAG: OB-fold protein [Bacteroidales bacterium]